MKLKPLRPKVCGLDRLLAIGVVIVTFVSSAQAACTEDEAQTCRLGALRCIQRNCAGVSAENPMQYRDCRAPCYVQLQRCQIQNFCQ